MKRDRGRDVLNWLSERSGLRRTTTPGVALAVGAVALVVALARMAAADFMAYGGKRDLRAEDEDVVVEHHHDWGRKDRRSWVRAVERKSGAERWRRDSPPLDVLWLSPDGRHVVGLSRVKLHNDHQLFLAATDGAFRHVQAVRCGTLRPLGIPCSESVTNFVHWYDGRDPGLELTLVHGVPVALSFNRAQDLACRFAESAEAKERCANVPRRATLPIDATGPGSHRP